MVNTAGSAKGRFVLSADSQDGNEAKRQDTIGLKGYEYSKNQN
jgi:hypothetical protein